MNEQEKMIWAVAFYINLKKRREDNTRAAKNEVLYAMQHANRIIDDYKQELRRQ